MAVVTIIHGPTEKCPDLLDLSVRSVTDKPWIHALRDGSAHCLVLGREAKVSPYLLPQVERLAEAVPDEPICLLPPGEAYRDAYKAGKLWCASVDGVNMAAMLLPRKLVLKWQSWATWAILPIDDEESLMAYFWSYGKRILHPMPPLATWRDKPGWLAVKDASWKPGEAFLVDAPQHRTKPSTILRRSLQDGLRSHYDFDEQRWTCEAAQAFAP